MKVCCECPPDLGRGIHRVVAALKRHAPPGVEFVDSAADADLLVHHVVGVANFSARPIDALIADQSKPYAIVQYCLRSTEQPTVGFWEPLWRDARCVWSYYQLDDFIADGDREPPRMLDNFYYAPLGVDARVFRADPFTKKRFTIGTSGYVAETEGVRECYDAMRAVGGAQFHLGPKFGWGGDMVCAMGMPDETLARMWSECRWVAGLRRVEGFELPAAEALLCGTRPVCFDAPHYRAWFPEADFVPEGSPAEVTAALTDLFGEEPQPLTYDEIAAARDRFNWRRLVKGFWERVL